MPGIIYTRRKDKRITQQITLPVCGVIGYLTERLCQYAGVK